jgi:predicted alpha/beta superfamily hydrolase
MNIKSMSIKPYRLVKSIFTIVIIVLFPFVSASQEYAPGMTVGQTLLHYSGIYNKKRELLVYYPASFQSDTASRKNMPVLYILDGEEFFLTAVNLQRMYAEFAMYPVLPEFIIVGIKHLDRQEELFTGKGTEFTRYLEMEVLPLIDSIKGGSGPRMLFGHSAGGLQILHFMRTKTGFFNAFMVSDPALHWDNQNELKALEQSVSSIHNPGLFLFLGISNLLPYKTDTLMVQGMDPNLVSSTSHFRLKHFLQKNSSIRFRYDTRYYKDESHFSVPFIALRDGLTTYFKNYRCQFFEWMTDPALDADVMINSIELHFEKLSSLLGYKIIPLKKDMEYYIKFLTSLGLDEKNRKMEILMKNWY